MAKTPLLLIPGMLCSPRLFAAQVAALKDQAEIVVPDWRRAPLSTWDTWRSAAQWVVDQMPAGRFAMAGLPKIKCPTIVVCGRDDAATPLFLSDEMAKAIPAAALVVVEQCGHLVTMEKPEETNEILRLWLSR